MPYIQRNESGAIVSLTALPVSDKDQFLPPDDPEVLEFLTHPKMGEGVREKATMELFAADLKMIRVVEDLVDLLTMKGIIMFSELPQAVQEKIICKRVTREKASSHDILVDDSKLPF